MAASPGADAAGEACALLEHAASAPAARPDRSAEYAAVRRVAESYGVELCGPLELGLTPLRRAAAAGARERALHTAPPTSPPPAPPALRSPVACSSGASWLEPADGGDAAAAGATAATAPSHPLGDVECSYSTYASSRCSSAADSLGAEELLCDDGDDDDGAFFFEEDSRLPLAQRITLLEEERDQLVDKLLATTELLHASEARNRQSEAKTGQVAALLEQLQELLRRAEVERDRAKLQLKRQRASSSQIGLEPGLSPNPFALALAAGRTASGARAAGLDSGVRPPRLKKYRASGSGAGRANGSGAGSRGPTKVVSVLPSTAAVAADKAAGSGEAGASDAAAPRPAAAEAGAPAAAEAADAGQEPGAADAPAGDAGAAAGDGASSVRAVRHSSSGGSSSGSCGSDAASSAAAVAALTPSTDDARPPVRSVISGFEALLSQSKPRTTSQPSSIASGGGGQTPTHGASAARTRSESGAAEEGPLAADLPAAAPAAAGADAQHEAPQAPVVAGGRGSPRASSACAHDSCSGMSTPTAAALHNTAPLGALLLPDSDDERSAAAGLGGAAAAADGAHSPREAYAQVAARNAGAWATGVVVAPSQGLQALRAGSGSSSPVHRALQPSSIERAPSLQNSGGKRGRSSSPLAEAAVAAAAVYTPPPRAAAPVDFGSGVSLDSGGGSSMGSPAAGSHVGSPARGSPTKGPKASSRLGMLAGPSSDVPRQMGASEAPPPARPAAAAATAGAADPASRSGSPDCTAEVGVAPRASPAAKAGASPARSSSSSPKRRPAGRQERQVQQRPGQRKHDQERAPGGGPAHASDCAAPAAAPGSGGGWEWLGLLRLAMGCAVLLVLGGWVVHGWLANQALQERVVQLERQLSERQACPPVAGAGFAARDEL